MLALEILEPTGGRIENIRTGMIATVLFRLKGNKTVTVNDFFPDGPTGAAKKGLKERIVEDWRVMKQKIVTAHKLLFG